MKILNLFWNPQQKRLRLLPRLILFALIYSLVFLIFSALFSQLGLTSLFANLGTYGLFELTLTALAVFLAARLLDRRRFTEFGFHFSRQWMKSLVFGLALGAILMAGIFALEWALGWVQIIGYKGTHSLQSSLPARGYFWGQFFQAMLFYFSAALSEEILFRGYLFKNLSEGLHGTKVSQRQAALLAMGLASAVFGLAHLANPYASWVSTLNIFFAGIMLSLGLIFSGELALSIGLHFTWNFFQGVIFGFPISGTASPANLIRIEQSGPQLFTGGQFGPEAGLLGLAAIFIGSLAIVHFFSKMRS